MKLVTYLDNVSQIERFLNEGVSEVIISNNQFSRLGKLSLDESLHIATIAKESGLRTVFEWDKLSTQDEHEHLKDLFNKTDLTCFDSIRIQDTGALFFVATKFPDYNIQLVLETAHHNSYSFQPYFEMFPGRIERVILSIELQSSDLARIIEKIPVPTEILGLGRILLFYTPRSLISPLVFDHDDLKENRYFEVDGNSEESPHKGFPIIENSRGTFMFNTSDFCLLEQINELKEMGIQYFRYDNRFCGDKLQGQIVKLLNHFSFDDAKRIKDLYPNRVIRGFYHKNKSDVLFPKLKNQHIQRMDENFLGEVFHVQKGDWIGIMTQSQRPVTLGNKIKLITPEGKEKTFIIHKLEDSLSNAVEYTTTGQFYKINYHKGITVRSSLYFA